MNTIKKQSVIKKLVSIIVALVIIMTVFQSTDNYNKVNAYDSITDAIIDDTIITGTETNLNNVGQDILCDVNGDSVVDVFDIIAGRQALIMGEYNKCGDVDMNGRFEINDLVRIQRFVLLIIRYIYHF